MNRGPNGKHWTQHRWTDQDKLYLVEHYQTDGPKKCAKAIGVPRPSVQYQAKLLGLTREAKPWTPEDVTFLEENYRSLSRQEMAELLDRTPNAVATKLHQLSKSETSPITTNVLPWTKQDDKKLKALHKKNLSISEISRQMNRGQTTVQRHMELLKLPPNRQPSVHWTETDLQYLRDNYVKLGGKACAEHLQRTLMSIQKQACRQKLTVPMNKPGETPKEGALS